MNSLSKLLYFGNVCSNLGGFCVFMGFVFLALSVALFIMHNCTTESLVYKLQYHYSETDIKKIVKRGLVPLWSAFFMFLVVVTWTLAVFTPSTDTVYAIAASEMGEKALQTPLAGKAEKALEKWLDDKIAAPAASTTETSK